MAPPKQVSDRNNPQKPKFEQLQADHELFLQAFEKPTQIYRFLAARNKISPIFLNRSLSYLSKRCSRTNERRKTFKPDGLLSNNQDLKPSTDSLCRVNGNKLHLTFQELRLSKSSELLAENVSSSVEIVLMRICHRRRKNVATPTNTIPLTSINVPVVDHHALEPSNQDSQSSSVLIPSASLGLSNGHRSKTLLLLFRVQLSMSPPLPAATNGPSLCNGDLRTSSSSPLPKRRRLSSSNSTPEKGASTPERNPHLWGDDCPRYFTELVLVDKQNRCQLTNGDYEVTLQEVKPASPHLKRASWETITSSPMKSSLGSSYFNPTLKFRLSWSQEESLQNGSVAGNEENVSQPANGSTLRPAVSPSPVHASPGQPRNSPARPYASPGRMRSSPGRPKSSPSIQQNSSPVKPSPESVPKPHTPTGNKSPAGSLRNGEVEEATDNNSSSESKPKSPAKARASNPTSPTKGGKPKRVYFQFLYNNNLRQQTEARDNLRCPWCSINCMELYGLLKHLTLSHSRFNFTLVPHIKGARIDVTINEHYDGSYAGNPHNLTSYTGYAFRRNGPCRRTPVTQIIVARPQRSGLDLSEFQEGEKSDYLTHRPIVSGHNRVYYHTHTLQPIRPQEMDEDSEAETDPEWMQERTKMMIDEFTDVNEGEKEVMKMWNMHCMKKNYISDSQIPTCCLTFVLDHGRELLSRGLCRNFLLHLVNLYDFSLLHPQLISQMMAQLDRIRVEMTSALPTVTSDLLTLSSDIPTVISDPSTNSGEPTQPREASSNSLSSLPA